jgi:hypothetical protein
MPSMPSLFRRSASPYLPSEERGCERLASLIGRSSARVSMAFGPHIGLLGESSFKTALELGELKSNLASMEKLREIFQERKARTAKQTGKEPADQDIIQELHKSFASAALPRVRLDR